MSRDTRSGKKRAGAQPRGKRQPRHDEGPPATPAPPPGKSSARPFPIAMIGSSAGGLDALKRFLGAVPEDSGIAFILIPHLDPRHESLMVELLRTQTKLPVVEARQHVRIKPNHIYVIPPNRHLAVERASIVLRAPPRATRFKPGIDFAMLSLAKDQREAAIGIVLSGTGTHGTEGIKEIKLAGGLVLVQDPATAEYEQMPQSALAAGVADYVLAPEKMPEALIAYVRRAFRGQTAGEAEAVADGLARVLAVLQARAKCDFRHYRKGTLLRRVRRRMALARIDDFAAYVERLREDADEVEALHKDLLIGVTAFFRDPDAFAALAEHVVPKLVERARPGLPVRVWVPGCSTGEEAYSIAMLLIEGFKAANKTPRIQIFATDIDDDALETARTGVYPDSIAASVSADRLAKFFVRHGERHYQVAKPLRDCVVFASQNLIGDPPFSKVDLVSCRNVLIYLEPDIQAKIISLLHFALNDDGYLLLGPSETVGRSGAMFEPLSKKWRLYRRTGSARRNVVAIPIVVAAERVARAAQPVQPRRRASFADVMQRVLAEEFAPASVLINSTYEILCLQGPVVSYLEFPPGEMTKDLLALARQGLRAKIRAACQKALNEGRVVAETDARVRRNGSYVPCSVTVRPVKEPKDLAGLLVVVFQDQSAPQSEAAQGGAEQNALVRQLESELRATREDLQTIVEELQSSNEELKASNDEVTSMNEELQSANEELETSKEELQALNEELITVNAQLQEKVEEGEKLNSDLSNLVTATDIATVFLDTELKIKRFTPSIRKLVNLLPTDVGRPFQSFAPRFEDDALLTDAERVIATLNPSEKEIHSIDHWYLRRISPYRAGDDRIGGVVITFVDVTQLRELATALEGRTVSLEANEHRIRAVLDATSDAIVSIDRAGTIETFNLGAERMFGYAAGEILGRDVGLLMPHRYWQAGEARPGRASHELNAVRKDGTEFPVRLTVREVAGLGLHTGIIQDITEQRRLQAEIVEIATLEQRRIGHELHDGIQQELLGIGLLAESLREALTARGSHPEAERAAKLAAEVSQTNRHVRELSRGLVPQAIEAAGLPSALAELAKTTQERHGLASRFETAPGFKVGNAVVATHLYRIAQEAVGNAVKHARAKSVAIKLDSDAGRIRLEVADDGVGIPDDARSGRGLGLRIMAYRCELIGGALDVARGEAGGTVVACSVPKERVEALTEARG